jgi:hypothetical protein
MYIPNSILIASNLNRMPWFRFPNFIRTQPQFSDCDAYRWRRGDSGTERASAASSAAFVRERYAVHAIPTLDTNG